MLDFEKVLKAIRSKFPLGTVASTTMMGILKNDHDGLNGKPEVSTYTGPWWQMELLRWFACAVTNENYLEWSIGLTIGQAVYVWNSFDYSQVELVEDQA
jgi:hypothetical protein